MQALLLVGGQGTRLRPLTATCPKPALPLVDRPLVRFVCDWVGRHGVEEVVLASGFRTADLEAAVAGARSPAVRLLAEPEPLGTAGPIRLACDRDLLDERFLVLNGDVLSDLDLSSLVADHRRSGAVATIGLHPVADVSGYGVVRREPDGTVTEFVEKPDPSEAETDEINAGVYVLERSVVDGIPPGREVSIEREVFPELVGRGLHGCRLEGYWSDVGTPERYLQASWDVLEGRVLTEVPERLDGRGVGAAASARVAADARLEPPCLVDDGAVMAAGSVAGPRAVVGPECVLREGARVLGSVLLAGCEIGAEAAIEGSILGSGARIGAGASIGAGSVIGEGASVADGASLDPGARVEAGEEVGA